jgi:nucleoid-associated protein YgaU
VKFCSDSCRSHKPGAQDRLLEETILRMLHERGAGKTICPSEAARTVAGGGELSDDRVKWEPLMEPARAAARRLVAAEKIVITQGGHAVDASTAKGAIRLRLR